MFPPTLCPVSAKDSSVPLAPHPGAKLLRGRTRHHLYCSLRVLSARPAFRVDAKLRVRHGLVYPVNERVVSVQALYALYGPPAPLSPRNTRTVVLHRPSCCSFGFGLVYQQLPPHFSVGQGFGHASIGMAAPLLRPHVSEVVGFHTPAACRPA